MSKKLFFLVAAILLVAQTQAESCCGIKRSKKESYITASPDVVTYSPAHTFEFTLGALFFKQSVSNAHYAAQAIPIPIISPHWNIFDIHPKYHAGFDVGIKAILHGRDTNLRLNWQRIHSKDHNEAQTSIENMFGPFFEIGPDAQPYKNTAGKVRFAYDEVNFNYGQLVSFGDYLQTNLFLGISCLRIKQQMTSSYSNNDGTIARTIIVPSCFTGAGVQVGGDFSYCVMHNLALVGNVTAGLIGGDLKNHTTYVSISPLLPANPNTQNTSVSKRFQVIPGFEQKIGFSYARESYCGNYVVQLEAGYQAKIYLHAIQSVDMGSQVLDVNVKPAEVGVFARTFQRNISSFALAGPYVTLMIGF